MSSHRCRLFHDWDRWTHVFDQIYKAGALVGYQSKQWRTCQRCGLIELRKLK